MLKVGSRILTDLFKCNQSIQLARWYCAAKIVSDSSYLSYEMDPGPVFIRHDIQKLLKSMTRLDLDKIYRKRSVEDNTVEYKFMTDDQLRKEVKRSIRRAEELLQMPPVVDIMRANPAVLSRDGALKGFSDTKMVFTDITYGGKNARRVIVERLTDGTLQEVPYETRKRLNQMYFPQTGRRIRTPKMFESAHLKKLLDAGEYEFILNRACVQFEPFEKEYHDLTATVYQHLNEHKAFDSLRSTRHFGPMCFFLAWHRLVDDLLLDMVKRDYLRNGVELIALYAALHDVKIVAAEFDELKKHVLSTEAPIFQVEEKTVDDLRLDEQYLALIEHFVEQISVKKIPLNLAISAYREMAAERQQLAEGVRKMHGE